MGDNSKGILALICENGLSADQFISDLGYRLRDAGVSVAGVVRHNLSPGDRHRGFVEIEEMASREILFARLDDNDESVGYALDAEQLADLLAVLAAELGRGTRLLLVNRFGKAEAERRGLCGAISDAIQRKIPTIVGVPRQNLEKWRKFTRNQAAEFSINSPQVFDWLLYQGVILDAEIGEVMPTSVTPDLEKTHFR